MRKFDINTLYICPPHLYTVATFTLGNPKKSFFNSIIHIYHIFFVISEENKLLPPLHTTPEKCYRITLQNARICHLTEGNVVFLQTLVALKGAGCGLALVALKRTSCDVWQLECQASNVTASVQSDHLVHGYMLPVFFSTDQLHSPPRCAEIQLMSQQDASATRPYYGLVLDTCTLAACPRCGNLLGGNNNNNNNKPICNAPDASK